MRKWQMAGLEYRLFRHARASHFSELGSVKFKAPSTACPSTPHLPEAV